MALADLRPKSEIWTGVAIGVGLLLAPVVIPIVAAGARPLVKMAVKAGDVVLFTKYAGTEIKIEGDEHLMLREDDILAIVEK